MIVSFRHKGLRRLYERGESRGINTEHLEKIENVLARLDSARELRDLSLPGFRLHRLTGSLGEFWSVTVRANWRIIFRFRDGDAHDVDLVDYH